ncbi:MAG: CotH kinase family protein [Paludibacteraceae bacterium]|nr:CotH kinase family protein [Paludibacteraceae bacterium]
MKNFTNSFKQFTSRLSARWLIMALMLLMGTSAMLAANTTQSDGSYRLYFKFSGGSTWWNNSGCYHYAWVWANGGAGQVQRIYKVGTTSNASTASTTDVFYMNIPNGMTLYGMILFRGTDAGPANGSTTWPGDAGYSWHNKTGDIVLPDNISTYNLVTAVTGNSTSVTQDSRYTTVSLATTTLSASGFNSGSGTQADPYVYDENGTMKLTASATIDDHNFTIQLAYGSSTATISSGGSKSIDVSLTTASSATAYAVTYTPLLGGSTSYKGTASTKTIYYKTAPTCTSADYTVSFANGATSVNKGSTLQASVSPSGNGYGGVTWSSSAPTVATVNSSGLITGVKGGQATITATVAKGDTYCGGSDAKTITVKETPAVTISGEQEFCTSTTLTASVTEITNGVSYSIAWYKDGGATSVGSGVTYAATASGTYTAKVTGTYINTTTSTGYAVTKKSAPATPTVSFSVNPVGQNKPTTLTVGGYNSTLNNYTLYKDGVSQGACAASQEITISEAREYDYHVVATSKACPSLTATSNTVTLTVQEAGVKIAALGSTALYTNDPTHFIPMYVSNEDLAGVDANSVKYYTWQYSEDGTSEWKDCTRIYSNFNAANNQSNGNVVVTNGSINCNNWRANQAGYYRCKLTYDNDEEQVSGNIQVTEATNNKTNKQHIGITYNLPIISVNTGATDFPSDADLATESSNCGNSRYPSIHADDLKKKRSVDVMMFNPDGTICYDRKARMNYRGSSSLNFQKKSYAFCPGKEKCGDDEKGADYVKTNKENLFGLSDGAADKDWVLYAATPDPSMMRNRLVFDLYKKMRPDEWGVNSMYVELVVNGEYRGVYVLMDKITNNANRVNIKNENGFIVKFDKTDVVDRVENTDGDQKTFATSRTGTKNSSNGNESYGTCIDQRFEIEYPEKEDIDLWDAFYGNVQQRFEDFETALANKDYATVRTLIDYDSWADWFILTELAKNQDGFRASCIFVYDGDKIEARPLWDQELSFNNGTRVKHGIADPEGLLITTSSVYGDAFYPPFWFTGNKGTTVTGGLLNDPCFVSLVKQKWATYQSGICSAASIGNMVAAYNTELGDAINREAARWPYDEATRGTTTDGDYIGYYNFTGNDPEGNSSTASSFAASKAAITAWASDRSTALDTNSGLGKAINDLNGEALIFTISPSNVETTPWKQVLLTVNAPEGYEYTFDDSSINNATVRASVKKDNNTYAIKIPRPTAWGIGGNGDPDTQTQYQVSATIEVSGESECGTIQNGTATSTITLTDVTEDCNPEIVKP